MAKKRRILYILHYLWDRTDEENRVTISELRKELEDQGFHANRKTIAMDLKELQENGFDIICVRSRQNQYFLGTRGLEPVSYTHLDVYKRQGPLRLGEQREGSEFPQPADDGAAADDPG